MLSVPDKPNLYAMLSVSNVPNLYGSLSVRSYAYVKGKGAVTLPDGTIVPLPRQSPKSIAPPTDMPTPASTPASTPRPTLPPPTILSIDFPSQIPADGSHIAGRVRFKDPDGDINRVTFDVVSASDFTPFEFNPLDYLVEGDATEGVFGFHTWSETVQQVTLRVTLYDAAGNSSTPVDFTFNCE